MTWLIPKRWIGILTSEYIGDHFNINLISFNNTMHWNKNNVDWYAI